MNIEGEGVAEGDADKCVQTNWNGNGYEGIRQSKSKINTTDNNDSDNAAPMMIICSIMIMMMRMVNEKVVGWMQTKTKSSQM